MMQRFYVSLIFFLLLLTFYQIDARSLPQTQGTEKEVTKLNGISHHATATTFKDDINRLMGADSLSEDCDDKDQECLNRRMIAEAHLDYIYTQHHKP